MLAAWLRPRAYAHVENRHDFYVRFSYCCHAGAKSVHVRPFIQEDYGVCLACAVLPVAKQDGFESV
jgi:hypothetical protein